MGLKCCITGCISKQNTEGVTLHRFPSITKHQQVHSKWLLFCGIDNAKNGNLRVCSLHFKEEDFYTTEKKRCLLPNRIPCMHPKQNGKSIKPTHVLSMAVDLMDKNSKYFVQLQGTGLMLEINVSYESGASKSLLATKTCNTANRGKYVKASFASKSKTKMDYLLNQLQQFKNSADRHRRNKNMYKESHRRLLERFRKYKTKGNRQIEGYKQSVEIIQQKCHETLQRVFTDNQIKKLITGKRVNWSSQDIALGIAIKYKANHYNELLKLNYPFPSIRVLQDWTNKITFTPGILEAAVGLLKYVFKDASKFKRQSVISFDEMAIDDSYVYDPVEDRVFGNKSNMTVFLVRGLFKKWKQIFAFDFQEKLTPDRFYNMMTVLEETGLEVRAVVSDMGGKNISFWNQIGIKSKIKDGNATVNNCIKSPVNNNNIYFFADVPHLIKLLRNNLLNHGIVLKNGEVITKQDFQDLLDVDSGDLKVCHRLSQDHITLTTKEKQRVHLATELFSASVVTLWRKVHKSKTSQAEFIQIVNDSFDVLNARHLGETATLKQPYGKALLEQNVALAKMEDAIIHLRRADRQSALPFQTGYVLSIRSLRDLYTELSEGDMNISYILPHRLNQDVLENTFGSVRGMGGHNPNPNAVDAMRRLKHVMLSKSETLSAGSVVQQDDAGPYLTQALFSQMIKLKADTRTTVVQRGDINTDTNVKQSPADWETTSYMEKPSSAESEALPVCKNEKSLDVDCKDPLINISDQQPDVHAEKTICNTNVSQSTLNSTVPTGNSHGELQIECKEVSTIGVAGYVGSKLKMKYPNLVTNEEQPPIPGFCTWRKKDSKLFVPSAEWYDHAKLLNDEFERFHGGLLSKKKGILFGFINIITHRYPEINPEAISLFIRTRTFIRIKFLNQQRKQQKLLRESNYNERIDKLQARVNDMDNLQYETSPETETIDFTSLYDCPFGWTSSVMNIAKEKFNITDIRKMQQIVINATMTGVDVIAIMPTGSGKSLIFQSAALISPGLTVVISPLAALILDQVTALQTKGIDAVGMSSLEEDDSNFSNRLENAKLLYITPEKWAKSKYLQAFLKKKHDGRQLDRFVIDEIHTIYQWGSEFRQDFEILKEIKPQFQSVPILGLTATATDIVLNYVTQFLNIPDVVVLKDTTWRENLCHYVQYVNARNKESEIINIILKKHPSSSGIIYCLTTKDCDNVKNALMAAGISAVIYYAKMSISDRKLSQQRWMEGVSKVIVATTAFGMGINKPDCRFVIHHSLSLSMLNYHQETGRAGRDGKASDCIMYFNLADTFRILEMVRLNMNGRAQLYEVLKFSMTLSACRNNLLKEYFGFPTEVGGNCSCDYCKTSNTLINVDAKQYLSDILKILDGAHKMKAKLTPVKVLNILYRKDRNDPLCKLTTIPTHDRSVLERVILSGILEGFLKEILTIGIGKNYCYLARGTRACFLQDNSCVFSYDANEFE